MTKRLIFAAAVAVSVVALCSCGGPVTACPTGCAIGQTCNELTASCVALSTDGGACTTDSWASYGAAFFATNCTSCHQHRSQFTTQSAVQAGRGSISSSISTGRMPQGISLSSSERSQVLRYLDCGAP